MPLFLYVQWAGGIFDYLPVATQTDAFDEHVATPPGLDFAAVATLFGLRYDAPATTDDLRAALDEAIGARGTTLLHVRTDRAANVALHRRVWDAVAHAVRVAR